MKPALGGDAELKMRAFALASAGRFAEALPVYSELCARVPQDAEAWYFCGAVHERLGQKSEAIAAMRQALIVRPRQVEWLNHLGTLLELSNDLPDAEECYRQVLESNPDHPQGCYNLGNVLNKRGLHEEALGHLRRAVQFFPNDYRTHFALGVSLKACGDLGGAITAQRRAVVLNPGYADAQNALGMALQEAGDRSAALSCYEAALRVNPHHAIASNNLGNMLLAQARLTEAQDCFRRAAEADPAWTVPHCNLLFAMNYDVTDGKTLLDAHRAWAVAHAPAGEPPRFGNTLEPGRRLRVGYVSPDFRMHSVAWFITGPLASHDRTAYDIYCYASVAKPDGTTEKLRGLDVTWRNIYGVSDDDACKMIREDRIDILVDLAGHTAGNRLTLFARYPAPVQVTWLGYPNTTGMTAVGYRLTDAQADPPGLTEAWHTERLARLPRGFLCYTPSPDAPPASEAPCRKHGSVTFGSFNALAKLSPAAVTAWSAILRAVPGSRLILKSAALLEEATRASIAGQFAARGIEPERIVLHALLLDRGDHLRLYGEIDIALDTFPYNGTTTTCEALWMGVPVITLAGGLHAGRVGISLLSQVGLEEFIAGDMDEYVRIAISLASDPARLDELRQGLRERMRVSTLCDATGFTRDLEASFREMWQRWCAVTSSD